MVIFALGAVSYFNELKNIQERFIDIRLFGATIPIKAEGGGSSIQITGPLQRIPKQHLCPG